MKHQLNIKWNCIWKRNSFFFVSPICQKLIFRSLFFPFPLNILCFSFKVSFHFCSVSLQLSTFKWIDQKRKKYFFFVHFSFLIFKFYHLIIIFFLFHNYHYHNIPLNIMYSLPRFPMAYSRSYGIVVLPLHRPLPWWKSNSNVNVVNERQCYVAKRILVPTQAPKLNKNFRFDKHFCIIMASNEILIKFYYFLFLFRILLWIKNKMLHRMAWRHPVHLIEIGKFISSKIMTINGRHLKHN